jgi:hypothetical protein
MDKGQTGRTCLSGCSCKKHLGNNARKCEPGCTCKRHEYVWREEWKPSPRKPCPEGCKCKLHRKHPEGCECGRHTRRSPEEVRESRAQRYGERRLELHERQYGLAPGELTRRFGEQGGCCYACGRAVSLTDVRGYAVDHDHACCPGRKACGKCMLGLACNHCNLGFGHFDDDPVLMVQAASRRMERMRANDSGRW